MYPIREYLTVNSYTNKMSTMDEKIEQFFYTMFPLPAYSQLLPSTHHYELPLK